MTSQTAIHGWAGDFTQVTGRTFPNLAACRAKFAGFGDYVDCLTECGYRCCYALDFGGTYLCFHPERQSIAKGSTASQSPPASNPSLRAEQTYSSHPGLPIVVIAGKQRPAMNPG